MIRTGTRVLMTVDAEAEVLRLDSPVSVELGAVEAVVSDIFADARYTIERAAA